MAVYALPANPTSTYVYRTFTSTHTLYQDALLLTSIACVLSSYSIRVANTSTLSVAISGSTLIISGYYTDCFIDQYFQFRTSANTTTLSSVTSYTSLPASYYKAVKFRPDLNTTTSVNIIIVTNNGTINMTQTVYNDWNYERNRFINGFIRRGEFDSVTSNTLYFNQSISDLPDAPAASSTATQLEVNATLSNFSSGTIYNFTNSGTYTVIARNNDIIIDRYMWGAGGGGTTRTGSQTGGGGGYSKGRITLVKDTTYVVVVGGGGSMPTAGTPGGGGTGYYPNSTSDGAGGGGYSALFISSVSQANTKIIAGGGGGGSGDIAYGSPGGGAGGVTAGGDRNGGSASQSAGGGGGTNAGGPGQAGSALQGGNGGNGAGGGGGYYGGGGGSYYGPGSGGGGSGWTSGSGVTNGSTTAGSGISAADPDVNKPAGIGDGGTSSGGSAGYVRFIGV